MRVLVVTNDLPTSRFDPQMSFIRDQACALARRGVDVSIIVARPWQWSWPVIGSPRWQQASFGSDRLDLQELRSVTEIRCLSFPGRINYLACAAAQSLQIRTLRREIQSGKYDAVLVHSEISAWAIRRVVARQKVPMVLVIHGEYKIRSAESRTGQKVLAEACRYSSALVLVGAGVKVPSEISTRACMIPNGYMPLDPVEGREEVSLIRPPACLILSVSRLVEIKGIQDNIKALARLRSNGIAAHYWIIGDGPLRSNLLSLAKELGVEDSVTFIGTISREKLGAYIEACDFFSLPSSREPFGIAHLEAAALGKPVICASGTGPAAFLEHGISAIHVSPGDVEGLADAWQELAQDTNLRASIGARAQQAGTKLTWDVNAERIEALFAELIASDS